MENEIKYYLKQIKLAMDEEENGEAAFKPQYMITAVKLPTGAIEIAINDKDIDKKIDYILESYDDDMCLKTNKEVAMQNIMIV